MAEAIVIEDPARGVRLEVVAEGTGEPVVLVPSAIRGAADFAQLQHDLAAAGYRSLAVNPRGAGRARRRPPASCSATLPTTSPSWWSSSERGAPTSSGTPSATSWCGPPPATGPRSPPPWR